MSQIFNLRNTKVDSVKWTGTWVNGKRKIVPVDIVKVRYLVDGKTIHIHGIIRPTKEKVFIYKYGRDNRFWGSCYHTKKEAIENHW